MKLLITGATGLVGKELVQRTLSQGVGVHFLTTRQSKINSIEGAKGFYWNPSLQEIDMDCFKGVDTIIHLAGATISKRPAALDRRSEAMPSSNCRERG